MSTMILECPIFKYLFPFISKNAVLLSSQETNNSCRMYNEKSSVAISIIDCLIVFRYKNPIMFKLYNVMIGERIKLVGLLGAFVGQRLDK